MEAQRLYIKGITQLRLFENFGLAILTDEAEKQQISIPCAMGELYSVERLIKGEKHAATLVALLWQMIKTTTESTFEIHITSVRKGSYVMVLFDVGHAKTYSLSAPDALTLALVAELPIYMPRKLFERQRVECRFGKDKMTLPVNILSNELLEKALQTAVANEDYELASAIKEEMDNRKEENE